MSKERLRAELTVAERLQLVLAAIGRDDMTEDGALRRSCPEGDVAEMTRLVTGLQWVLLTFAVAWLDANRGYAASQAAELARGVGERMFRLGVVYAQAAGNGADPGEALEPTRSRLADDHAVGFLWRDDPEEQSQINEQRRSDLRSTFRAFLSFCSAVELDPTLVLGTSPALANEVLAAADVLGEDSPGPSGITEELERELQALSRGPT